MPNSSGFLERADLSNTYEDAIVGIPIQESYHSLDTAYDEDDESEFFSGDQVDTKSLYKKMDFQTKAEMCMSKTYHNSSFDESLKYTKKEG